ncbi:hypothetical protein ACRAWC_24750 [Leifsonia sp. L25]|uniref:hypothetical protein n=1 Tax=Leifsonia sp. L25 TaxID=3423957 RepID=UPI003D69F1E0
MNRLRRLSITARITIGSLVVAALFALVAVVIIRIGVSSILHNATLTLLNNDVSAPAEGLTSKPSGPFDLPGGGQELAIVSADGTILASTMPEGLEDRMETLVGQGGQARDVQVGDEHYLVLSRSVTTSDGVMHVVAARNEETTALLLDRLTAALLIGAGVLIFAFGAASLAAGADRPAAGEPHAGAGRPDRRLDPGRGRAAACRARPG